eukprot:scaffold185089_cov19-Tisochrysis_lutea.AAC.1
MEPLTISRFIPESRPWNPLSNHPTHKHEAADSAPSICMGTGFGGFGDFLPGEKAAALSPADAGW